MDTKIYFCDLCNESIPQEDLEKSHVTTVRGKMICAKCVPPPAGSAAATGGGTTAAASSGSGALFGLVAIVLGGAGLFVAMQTKTHVEAQPNLKPKLDNLEKVVDNLAEDLSNASKRAETLVARLSKVEAEPGALRESLADQLHRIEAEERASRDAKTKIDWLSSSRDQAEKLGVTQQGLERDVAELKTTVQALAGRVSALAAAPPVAPSGGGDAAGGVAPKDEGPKFDADTKALLAEITSKDSVKRWLAVEKLRKKHDPNLVPYLLPLLDDSDAFVQFNTITALRELNARSAVGRLVKLLRDPNKTVHEEAQEALVTLTGNAQLHFDIVNGTPAEREKGIKAWEDWYAKNKERFSETAASS